jgi:hypothetical protein
MLVQLAKNSSIANSATGQFSYACESLSDVYIQCDFASGADVGAFDITVQAGNEILMNRIPFEALSQMFGVINGGPAYSGGSVSEAVIALDFGQFPMDIAEELLVTIDNASGQACTTDVYADVNLVLPPNPIAYVYRKDESFSVELCQLLVAYDSGGGMDEASGTTTFKSGDDNILVNHSGAWTRTLASGLSDASAGSKMIAIIEDFGDTPRNITVNCDDSTVYHICQVTPEGGVESKKINKHTAKLTRKLNLMSATEKVASLVKIGMPEQAPKVPFNPFNNRGA